MARLSEPCFQDPKGRAVATGNSTSCRSSVKQDTPSHGGIRLHAGIRENDAHFASDEARLAATIEQNVLVL